MFACFGCHKEHECPSKFHERVYWERCELCGKEQDCVDCMIGRRKKLGTDALTAQALRAMYMNTAPLRYPTTPRRRR